MSARWIDDVIARVSTNSMPPTSSSRSTSQHSSLVTARAHVIRYTACSCSRQGAAGGRAWFRAEDAEPTQMPLSLEVAETELELIATHPAQHAWQVFAVDIRLPTLLCDAIGEYRQQVQRHRPGTLADLGVLPVRHRGRGHPNWPLELCITWTASGSTNFSSALTNFSSVKGGLAHYQPAAAGGAKNAWMLQLMNATSTFLLIVPLVLVAVSACAEETDDEVVEGLGEGDGDGDGGGDGGGDALEPATCQTYCALYSSYQCPGHAQCPTACTYISNARLQCQYGQLLLGDCQEGDFYSTKCGPL